ncbi:putative photosynthetic complex assembly protein 2 [Loktanella sp. DSM 29012]|uniref:putative photosynthetic complex assembly protein PuhE n=1 Tax=Loktanella sp. DSM 29012 TaxID=1881056 RepID=UPI0008B46047|nr:putative photosynthetic complex assembly protein PuhE [Loktanella sp. DSM 29012]SEP67707.1 putative photosynthetic complex assembly protein 2 [Loktanella sp. DSM 29012]
MTGPIWLSVGLAVFLWWFFTGAILLVVRLSDRLGGRAPLWATLAGLPLLGGGALLVSLSLDDPSVTGIYAGFLGALAIWGWVELAFLTGVISGWQRDDCPPGLAGWARFQRAFATVGYHELALATGALTLTLVSTGAANQLALATYLILFLARITAKLNLFLGVPRINSDFVPVPLTHLKTYFRRGPVTWMFPLAITILTALLAVCTERLWGAQTYATTTGYALLTALAALALIEHWLMVIPLPDAKLWAWMLPSKTKTEGDENGL